MQSYQTAWAVGEYDTVVKSVDRGDTWYEVQTGVGGVGQHWYSVAFYNSTHGWIVGAYGKVIYTNGGGETGSWIEQFSDVSQVVGTGTRPAYGAFLYDIQILDGGVALMVGQSGNIRRTYNWGETWEEVEALASYDFLALHFVTALRGWVVGDCGERILYTEDGGDTWSWQFPSEFLDDTGQFEQRLLLNDILFISDNVGFAVGREGRMLRTDHGGIDFSWHYVESCTSYALYSIALDPLSGEGFIVGNERVTCYSVDNGTDWSYLMVLPGQGGSLSAVSQWGSDNLAQAAGDFGAIALQGRHLHHLPTSPKPPTSFSTSTTPTFPASTSALPPPPPPPSPPPPLRLLHLHLLHHLHHHHRHHPLLHLRPPTASPPLPPPPPSPPCPSPPPPMWNHMPGPTTEDLHDIALASETEGWIVGEGDTILHSSDGGATWLYGESGIGKPCADCLRYVWYSASFLNSTLGWVVGSYGTAIRTSDGGMSTWTLLETGVQPTLMLYGVVAVNSSTVFAVGDANTIIRSTDGGNTWVHQNSRTRSMAFKAVYFVNESTGYVVGYNEGDMLSGRILYTDDAGETWQYQYYQPNHVMNTIVFISDYEGWAAGGQGVFIHTTDGGVTWKQHRGCSENEVYDLAMDGRTGYGYAVGYEGVICNTEDFGQTWNLQVGP
ncbi:hypothetical protein CYMTET_8499 [Cymbomonas tetramitiformis]|uniref:Photosynthesis system II assembly factor Ycf48/Hcf136-like domain-containing protein n=1 Tax=Cymbomonas tetramitiformis TaxID=36881 RepID=A0AAE0GTM8_9CHLO|nr:hypothetical protein CYMTET_8499 [Cymbomonas tetramitiformis]